MTYTELQKGINNILDEISEQMYNGNYKGVYLQDIYIDMKTYLHGYIDKNFPSSIDTELNKKLKLNIDRFLAGKNYQQWKDMTNLLYDKNGVKVPLKDFKLNSKTINKLYNDTWFKTENNFIGNSLNVAKRLQTYTKLDNKKYALKYIATNDELTRDSHRDLNGVIKPIGDPFWASHMPPWDYNCRCSVQAVKLSTLDSDYIEKSEEKIQKSKQYSDKIPQGLNQNVYSSGKFFNDNHPYISDTNKDNDIESVLLKLNNI